jgi:hypothetical protein
MHSSDARIKRRQQFELPAAGTVAVGFDAQTGNFNNLLKLLDLFKLPVLELQSCVSIKLHDKIPK